MNYGRVRTAANQARYRRGVQKRTDLRNIAMIAHVDHGKTTLVDAMLRQQSGGSKSIDDFAKAFFGVRDGDWGELTYTFDDVAATLNAIQPYDWAGFLRKRITETGQPAPVNGFAMNGYKLVYTAEPTKYFTNAEKSGTINVTYSVGLSIAKDGEIGAVIWDSPAFKAGLDVGTVVQAVNGVGYSGDVMKAAIVTAQTSKEPIRLLVKNGTRYREVAIDYHNGPRYPRLQKIGTGDTGLDKLLMPR